MSFRNGGARLVCRAVRQVESPCVEIPAFLCPALLGASSSTSKCSHPRRKLHSISQQTTMEPLEVPEVVKATAKETHLAARTAKLPPQCFGCGALTQTVEEEEPGFFNLKRKTVREYLEDRGKEREFEEEDEIVERALKLAAEQDPELAKSLKMDHESRPNKEEKVEVPMCERCHKLKHHETGVSIHHPSLHSIEDTINESPHKYNHVYHVIDAADFPMSMVPGLHKLLNLTPLRSLNRRAKTGKFYHGKKTEISFIITRSDLLAPKKEMVDNMMPYFRSVLRTALGRVATDVRLGNLRCVSAKRGWWTSELKEDIWHRGGGGWMVGKVNVGKSQLFHEVFPKGRRAKPANQYGKPLAMPTWKETEMRKVKLGGVSADDLHAEMANDAAAEAEKQAAEEYEEDNAYLETDSLLPPMQREVDYPAMPLVSALPGTTASPIRVPFGNGKGELIDLPGLSRGDLELHVQPEHRSSLVMRSRIRPEQQSIRPGQSLLLGGFIRITPTTPDLVFLSYVFNPLHPHLCSTEKAIGTQTQVREAAVQNISLPETGEKIKSAGTFHLKWDVTKERAGPITRGDAVGISVERLPYRVMAADILIEGCGWVELVAQIRKPRREAERREWRPHGLESEGGQEMEQTSSWGWGKKEEGAEAPRKSEKIKEEKDREEKDRENNEPVIDPSWPAVEVFSPLGKFVGVRQPMNAWLLCADKPGKKAPGRPRRSMKGMKKLGKVRARAL